MVTARPPRAFRATGAVVLFGLCAVMAVVLLGDAVVRSGPANAALLAPWPLLVVWGVYVVGVASDVRADATGVRVQNLLRRTWVPWGRVDRISMRWQLEFALYGGEVLSSFGGPARSRPRRLGPGGEKERENADEEDGIAALHRLRSESQTDRDAVIVRGWDWISLVIGLALVVWAVNAVAVTH
ncbi:PH domain-containing protein [Microbacterium sp.]|uniref:PH domain-containing protein n=1 Tax=Microbacterium sp. TaxID=51671 RepID=UPI003C721893